MIIQATAQKQSPKQSLPKVNLKSNCPQAHCGTLDSYFNQMIKYHFPHTQFDQINDYKNDTYLHEKLSTKVVAEAANKNTKPMFTKTGRLIFS